MSSPKKLRISTPDKHQFESANTHKEKTGEHESRQTAPESSGNQIGARPHVMDDSFREDDDRNTDRLDPLLEADHAPVADNQASLSTQKGRVLIIFKS